MSSWKRAAKASQKTHRERSQPEARKHLGLLEKKKDYRLRAADKQQKEATLKLLRKKTLNKNPDEFYHHMINTKIKNGKHIENKKSTEYTPAQIALMQTQDLKYITMKRTVEANKIKRLESELHMVDEEIPNTHTFFVYSDDEMDHNNFDVANRLNTHPKLLSRRANRPRINDLINNSLKNIDGKILDNTHKLRKAAYNELKVRKNREKELTTVQQEMVIKRALKENRKLKPQRIRSNTSSIPSYKFKYERKG